MYWILILMVIGWISCDPPIVFKTPPPQGIETINAFAPSFQGTYLCESDSSIVVVEPHVIYKTEWFDFVISQKEMQQDDNFIQSGEFIYLRDIGKCSIYRIKNDTVYASVQLADTIFYMAGEKNVLKEYKGHQVMSMLLNKGSYEVFILSLDEDSNLEFKMATLPGTLADLQKITPLKGVVNHTKEAEQFEINPTMMEFDEILKQEIVFETCDYFKRINIPNQALFLN